MTRTPWGDSAGLRTRRLRPGPAAPRAEVERNQRERLMAAMVAAVEEHGYPATTVAELVRLSGVSRSAFYRHFDNREECFLAAVDEIVERALRTVAGHYRDNGDWEAQAQDALRGFFGLLADQPPASRLVFVESYAAGPAAVAKIAQAGTDFESLAMRALSQMPERDGLPRQLVAAVLGGLQEMICARLSRCEEAALMTLAPQLVEAVFDYRNPPASLLVNGRRRRGGSNDEILGPQASAGSDDPAERIIAAATAAMASRGYVATTLDAVVAEASVSLSTLYEHFEGKEALLAAVLDSGQARMLAVVEPAYRRGRDWPESVNRAIAATFRYLAANPDFARIGMVEIFGAGRWAVARRERTIERFTRILKPGFEHAPGTSPIAAELGVSSILALIHEQTRKGETECLPTLTPLATYIALSPFLGAEQACAVAVGSPASAR